jgi:hypothetical protein
MRKYDHLTAILVLIVLWAAVTIKTISLSTMSAAALPAATVSGRTVAGALSKPKVIVSAPIIDRDARFFVGSGDVSSGFSGPTDQVLVRTAWHRSRRPREENRATSIHHAAACRRDCTSPRLLQSEFCRACGADVWVIQVYSKRKLSVARLRYMDTRAV